MAMENFRNLLVDQLNPKVNAPQWAASITGLIGTTLGLAVDDPWMAVIGAAVGAVLGWIVQKLFTLPADDQLEGHFVAADLPLVPEDLETIAADAAWDPEELTENESAGDDVDEVLDYDEVE